MFGTSNAQDLGGQANDLNGSSNYGMGSPSATPSWLFPVMVFRTGAGK